MTGKCSCRPWNGCDCSSMDLQTLRSLSDRCMNPSLRLAISEPDYTPLSPSHAAHLRSQSPSSTVCLFVLHRRTRSDRSSVCLVRARGPTHPAWFDASGPLRAAQLVGLIPSVCLCPTFFTHPCPCRPCRWSGFQAERLTGRLHCGHPRARISLRAPIALLASTGCTTPLAVGALRALPWMLA